MGNARIYQVQFTIPGVLNVSGGSLYGSPVIEFGHTTGAAWTLTASHATRFTFYRLNLVPGDPASYLVDGHAVAMGKQDVSVKVRDAAGNLATVTRTLYSSVYGPVLANSWTTSNAFAIRDAGSGNVRSVDEFLAMGQSENLAQFRAAEDTYQGTTVPGRPGGRGQPYPRPERLDVRLRLGQRSGRDRARHLRAQQLSAAHPHRLRGQLQ